MGFLYPRPGSAALSGAPAGGKETKWVRMVNKHQKAPGPGAPVQDWDLARGDPGPDVQPQLPGLSWTGGAGQALLLRTPAQFSGTIPAYNPMPVLGFPEVEKASFYFEDTRELYQLFFALSFLRAPSAAGEPETQSI